MFTVEFWMKSTSDNTGTKKKGWSFHGGKKGGRNPALVGDDW